MKVFFSGKVFLASLLFLVNCFEYDEVIIFNKNHSGTIEINYQVPLKDDQKTSLIRHLPAGKEEIQAQLSQGFRKAKIEIKDYSFELLTKGQFNEPFFDYKGRVSYKVDFDDITDIERALPGNMIAKSKGRTLTIRREFPSFSQEFLENISVGEKKIISEIAKLLKEGNLRFRVNFPLSTECISNRGFINLGSLSYTYYLTESLEESPNRIWEYKLRFFQ